MGKGEFRRILIAAHNKSVPLPTSEIFRINAELLEHGMKGPGFELILQITNDRSLLTVVKSAMTSFPALWDESYFCFGVAG